MPEASSQPDAWRLFRTWLSIGAQSFGGGAATSYLIQQNFVARLKLVEPDEYARLSAMVQLVPGMNLLALTALIGWRLRGAQGVVLSLAGLLVPSVSIALMMGAAYLSVQNLPVTQAALRGVVPAMAGVSLATLVRTTQPVFEARRGDGGAGLALAWALTLAGAGLAWWREDIPVFAIYVGSGALMAVWVWARRRPG